MRNLEGFGMDPDTYKIRNMRAMPHVTRGADIMGICSEDKALMGQNTAHSYQQLFVEPTLEMVHQRYEDISPPEPYCQKELPDTYNEPIDLHKNPDLTVTGKSAQIAAENIRSTKNMTTMQHNTEKYSYSQTNQYFETHNDKNDILAIENIGVPAQNISEMQPLYNLPTPSDPALEVSRWRDAEMPQPFIYQQLEHPKVAQFPEVAVNAEYIPAEHINRIQEDVRELPQSFTQSTQQKFNQSYQRYEETTQNLYPQIPPYFDQNLYNPRPVQPSRSEYRHHQMPEIRGPQPPNQYQQHRKKTLPRPYYVSGQSAVSNQKQQQSHYHSHNSTSYKARRPSKVKQQRLQQHPYLRSYGQQNTNLNTTQQQPSKIYWSQEQQRLLDQIYKYQRLCDYYQYLFENSTTLRNMQINR